MKYLLAVFIAWCIVQAAKRILNLFGLNKRVFSSGESALFVSGGMPSGHSAAVTTLALLVGLIEGFDTVLFALSGLFAVIIMYDAAKVRRSSGEQGEALNSLIREQSSRVRLVRVAYGHMPHEVLAGAAIGVFVAIVVFFATK